MRELFQGLLTTVRSPRQGLEKPVVRQFAKFSLVGTANTVTSFAVYLLATRIAQMDPLVANALAFLIAVSISFLLNKHWTFRDRGRRYLSQYIQFFSVSIVGFGISETVLFVLHKLLGLHDILAYLVAVAGGLLWNFNVNRTWTFSRRDGLQ